MMFPGRRKNDEETLLHRAVAGDQEAFGELYERYYAQIYRYIYYRIGQQPEAEDLTANVFMKAWEALPKLFADQLNFRAWLFRIAHNLIVDRHRLLKPQVSIDLDDAIHDPEFSPETTHEENETSRHLHELIRTLEPEYQQVITCRFISGFSHSETAKIMNRSEVYVRVLQYRALKKLKSLLSEEQRNNGRSYSTNSGDLY